MTDEAPDTIPDNLLDDQIAGERAGRAWAIKEARNAVQIRQGGPLNNTTHADTNDLLRVAHWILTGHDIVDDWAKTLTPDELTNLTGTKNPYTEPTTTQEGTNP